ncbi:MAG: hypothetical protein FJY20_01365 [Bacteroidetes bacterium]|nr:hypothetical protein [Bacteroidota bacterium]
MRKFSAILLIGIFSFSQYARQLSYLQCTLLNTVKQPDQQCDCAKQAGFDKQEDGEAPVHKAHFHIRMDEFFPFTGETELKMFLHLILQQLPAHFSNECAGHYPAPWQPPNS